MSASSSSAPRVAPHSVAYELGTGALWTSAADSYVWGITARPRGHRPAATMRGPLQVDLAPFRVFCGE